MDSAPHIDLRVAIDLWRRELQDIEAELVPLTERRDRLREKIDLAERLQRLESPTLATPESETKAVIEPDFDPLESFHPRIRQMLHAARQILRDRGEPLHVTTIVQELRARDVPIPGQGNESNLISHLIRAPHVFHRTGRGTYELQS
jgi:hypothetical protein